MADTAVISAEESKELVESHYNLARSLARRFLHRGESLDDLEQVAFLALVAAGRRYDPDHGCAFASFATVSILGELKRHFRDKAWMMRVPRSLQEMYLAVRDARDRLAQELKASPTIQHIAGYLGISEEEVLDAMEAGRNYWAASLNTPLANSEDQSTEIPVLDERLEVSLDLRELKDALRTLEPRQKFIVKRLYFDERTQTQVAEEIGVSQMQVSRLLSRTLGQLRAALGT